MKAALKKGQIIKLYFHCYGLTSEEDREVRSFNKETLTTTTTIHPDEGREAYEKFDRKTGRCLNDCTFGGGRRTIDPI